MTVFAVDERGTILLADTEHFGSLEEVAVCIADATALGVGAVCPSAPARYSSDHGGGSGGASAGIEIVLLVFVVFFSAESIALQFPLSLIHSLLDLGGHSDAIGDDVVQDPAETFAWGNDAAGCPANWCT
jgi:hypothetical protein